MTEEMTESESNELYQYLAQSQSAPMPEEKYNVHTFLHRVATADDTTKVGNLSDAEVGTPKHPTRALKEFALIAGKIINNPFFEDYFSQEAEIVSSTSLSKEGFLVKQATTQTRQIADVTKKRMKNKGWFQKKEDKVEGEQG